MIAITKLSEGQADNADCKRIFFFFKPREQLENICAISRVCENNSLD